MNFSTFEMKFLGLQSINFYILSIFTQIFHSDTKKKPSAPNALKFSQFLA